MVVLGYDARERRLGDERSVAVTLFVQRTAQAEDVHVWAYVRTEAGSAGGAVGFGSGSPLWQLPAGTIVAPTERLQIVGDGAFAIGVAVERGALPAVEDVRWFTR